MIQGLEAGEEYVLKETKTPNGMQLLKHKHSQQKKAKIHPYQWWMKIQK